MPLPSLQTLPSDIGIWRGLTAAANSGSRTTLRAAILALSGGAVPTGVPLEVELFASGGVVLRVYREGPAANAGGNYITIASGASKVIPLVNGLDSLSILSDTVSSTTCDALVSFAQ